MAKSDRSLVVDIGSSGLRICEFGYPANGGFVLQQFKAIEYTEQLNEHNRTLLISAALRTALEEGGFTESKVAVCVSGQAAFMRFVKLPPVTEEESRVRQIVEYEARQNVPFPMDEVIWDYQLIGNDDEELEVMFVVIKNDIVEGVIQAVTAAGLRPDLVDFAPAALYNVARANHVGDNECVMILNIGGRCTNLLFLDGDRFFARTIPIAGFSITQQVAKEFSISIEEAEVLKRRHGFVALGGAYEEPESEVAATISKIVRNVMTRLHGEVNRSISVYRTQQKGNKPTHLYLSGGSSTMAFTDHFFSEKLRMDVSYLNPFKIVSLSKNLNVDKLQEVAHVFSETVGVGLRNAVVCPVEVSLIPESLKRAQKFSKQKPFIFASYVVWVMILLVFVVVNTKTAQLFSSTADRNQDFVDRLTDIQKQINFYTNKQAENVAKFNGLAETLERRYDWSRLYNELNLIKPRDVWLVEITPLGGPIRVATTTDEPVEDQAEVSIFGQKKSTANAATAAAEPTADVVQWFALSGHCVTIPGRKIFTSEQLREFAKRQAAAEPTEAAAEKGGGSSGGMFGKKKAAAADSTEAAEDEAAAKRDVAEDEAAAGEAAGGNEGTAGEETDEAEGADTPAPAPVIDPADAPENTISINTQLPEIFLKSLQQSELFAAEDTRILRYQSHQNFDNLSSFKIQLKLNTPIKIGH